jgi:hypothetical protein
MPFRSACGPTLVGLHLLLRMATPFCGDGYTFGVKGCSPAGGMVLKGGVG